MSMRVAVGLIGWIVRQVLVLMVFVMHMRMRVFHRPMFVLVFVVLGQVQPDAGAHQEASRKQLEGKRLPQEKDRCEST